MLRDCWRQHFLGNFFSFQNPKYYIPLERYFCADSEKGLPHIKKIVLSKFIAILRPHDDINIFLGKKYFSRISPLEIHYFVFLIILSNCFCVWYNLLCEEQFESGTWYADDSFITSFLNIPFFILA